MIIASSLREEVLVTISCKIIDMIPVSERLDVSLNPGVSNSLMPSGSTGIDEIPFVCDCRDFVTSEMGTSLQ